MRHLFLVEQARHVSVMNEKHTKKKRALALSLSWRDSTLPSWSQICFSRHHRTESQSEPSCVRGRPRLPFPLNPRDKNGPTSSLPQDVKVIRVPQSVSSPMTCLMKSARFHTMLLMKSSWMMFSASAAKLTIIAARIPSTSPLFFFR